jgi:hypothetical protein
MKSWRGLGVNATGLRDVVALSITSRTKVGSVVTSFLRGAVHTDLRHGLANNNNNNNNLSDRRT